MHSPSAATLVGDAPGRTVPARAIKGTPKTIAVGDLPPLRTRQVTIESGRAAKAARRLRLSAAVRAIVSFRVLRSNELLHVEFTEDFTVSDDAALPSQA